VVTGAPNRNLDSHDRAWRDSARKRPLSDASAPTSSRDEAEPARYRRAAEDALQQLDWCIGYLHGTGKTKVSRVLARNRSVIRSELLRLPAEPLPVEQADPSSRRRAPRPDRRPPPK
jgi:hypothetical protein